MSNEVRPGRWQNGATAGDTDDRMFAGSLE